MTHPDYKSAAPRAAPCTSSTLSICGTVNQQAPSNSLAKTHSLQCGDHCYNLHLHTVRLVVSPFFSNKIYA